MRTPASDLSFVPESRSVIVCERSSRWKNTDCSDRSCQEDTRVEKFPCRSGSEGTAMGAIREPVPSSNRSFAQTTSYGNVNEKKIERESISLLDNRHPGIWTPGRT